MKRFALCLLLSLPLVFSACAPSQTTTVPAAAPATPAQPAPPPVAIAPPAKVEPSPVVAAAQQSAPIPTPTPPVVDSVDSVDSISEKRLARAQEPKTLLQVIRDAGVPDDNLIPGRKEQIAVYQRVGKYQFYHFRDSRLVATGEYPRSLIEQMQQRGAYPQEVLRDFARLPQ